MVRRTLRGLSRAVDNLAAQSLVATNAFGKGIVEDFSVRAAVTQVASE